MIRPGTYELTPITVGLTYSKKITIMVNGAAKNLTGCTPVVYLYRNGELYATLTEGSGLTIGAVAGTITIGLSVATTTAYSEGDLKYYLDILENDGISKWGYLQGVLPVTARS